MGRLSTDGKVEKGNLGREKLELKIRDGVVWDGIRTTLGRERENRNVGAGILRRGAVRWERWDGSEGDVGRFEGTIGTSTWQHDGTIRTATLRQGKLGREP